MAADPVQDRTALPRVPMRPVEMEAVCPGCHRPHELSCIEWREDESGAYVALDDAQFPVCGYCGLQFEVAAVMVVEASDAR